MNAYREWFRLEIEHAYFGERGFAGWQAVPDPATRAAIRRERLLVRQVPGAFLVLAPVDPGVALEPDLSFVVDVAPSDPYFGVYSSPEPVLGQVLAAGSRGAVREASGAWRLHAGQCLDSGALTDAGACAPAGSEPPPVGTCLRVTLTPPAPAAGTPAAAAPLRYLVRFAAASTYWKYYLQGGLAERALSVVDADAEADGGVRFVRTDDTEVGGRKAAVFLSDRPIALSARPGQRFQLREQAAFGEKVLMKRLPVAGAGGRTRALVDGQAVPVSEMFLYF